MSIFGYVLFSGSHLTNASDTSLPVSGDRYLLAPLWLRGVDPTFFLYPVSVATFNSEQDQQGQPYMYLGQISNFIGSRTGITFSAKWMVVAQWKMIPVVSDQYSNDNEKVRGSMVIAEGEGES